MMRFAAFAFKANFYSSTLFGLIKPAGCSEVSASVPCTAKLKIFYLQKCKNTCVF